MDDTGGNSLDVEQLEMIKKHTRAIVVDKMVFIDFVEQFQIVESHRVVSGRVDLDRKSKKRRDSEAIFRNRVSRKKAAPYTIAYQEP